MVLFLPLPFVPGAETPPPAGAIDGLGPGGSAVVLRRCLAGIGDGWRLETGEDERRRGEPATLESAPLEARPLEALVVDFTELRLRGQGAPPAARNPIGRGATEHTGRTRGVREALAQSRVVNMLLGWAIVGY